MEASNRRAVDAVKQKGPSRANGAESKVALQFAESKSIKDGATLNSAQTLMFESETALKEGREQRRVTASVLMVQNV